MTKKPEEKQPELVEITEREFLHLLQNSIDSCEERIQELEACQNQFVKLYKKYMIDKGLGEQLVFYTQGSSLMYDVKKNRGKVGYKLNTT